MQKTNGRPAVILFADDDLGDQEIVRRALEYGKIQNKFYVVQDGEAALDYLLRRGQYKNPETSPRPDLLLLDINMPKVDGRQVLKEIRSNPDLRLITVVVLTTSRQEEDILRSYALGANSYITKPVDFDQFIHIVQMVEEYWLQIVVLPPYEER